MPGEGIFDSLGTSQGRRELGSLLAPEPRAPTEEEIPGVPVAHHVIEAGRRAEAVHAVLSTLQAAEFPTEHPAYVRILESLAEIEEYAHKWGDKGYWAKRFGVSMSAGTSKAIKYKHLFELQFQVRIGIRARVRVRVRVRGWVGDI